MITEEIILSHIRHGKVIEVLLSRYSEYAEQAKEDEIGKITGKLDDDGDLEGIWFQVEWDSGDVNYYHLSDLIFINFSTDNYSMLSLLQDIDDV
jgi:hypothetical protein